MLSLLNEAISKAIAEMISLSSDEAYTDRWVESTFKGSDAGKFKWSAGKFYNDADLDKGKPVVSLSMQVYTR